MAKLAVQPYYKVTRKVVNNEQLTVMEEREMHLYREKIVTKHREFPIAHVVDLSYKPIGKEGGLLYLHTKQGLYTYTVASDPQSFIESCKTLL